jgi:hypothetical protein
MRDHRLWQLAWPVCRGVGMAMGQIPQAAFLALLADEEQAQLEAERLEAYRRLERMNRNGIGDVE